MFTVAYFHFPALCKWVSESMNCPLYVHKKRRGPACCCECRTVVWWCKLTQWCGGFLLCLPVPDWLFWLEQWLWWAQLCLFPLYPLVMFCVPQGQMTRQLFNSIFPPVLLLSYSSRPAVHHPSSCLHSPLFFFFYRVRKWWCDSKGARLRRGDWELRASHVALSYWWTPTVSLPQFRVYRVKNYHEDCTEKLLFLFPLLITFVSSLLWLHQSSSPLPEFHLLSANPHSHLSSFILLSLSVSLSGRLANGSRTGWSWQRRAIRSITRRGHWPSRVPVQTTMAFTTVVPRMQPGMSAATATSLLT